MHETGHLGLVHWDDPEGWDGIGREVAGGFGMGTDVQNTLLDSVGEGEGGMFRENSI